ncbi:predicted protein, partial [Nematostella vectensis]
MGSLTYYPNHVSFTCDKGFLLRGSEVRACQANRTWSGMNTRCEAVDCGPLAAPRNGSMSGSLTVYPNTKTFTCDRGFELLGSSLRRCTPSGLWDGTNAICRAVDCGPLSPPMNGTLSGHLTVFPNSFSFSCDEGFDLLGSSVRQCTAERRWSGTQTTCKAVDCGPLTVPVNGSSAGSLTYFPNKISFECDKGFLLDGSRVRVCQENRKWSGETTTCNAVDCGPLSIPLNGSRTGSLTIFPNVVKFSCDEGFDLLGSSVRQCTSKGQWDGNTASCKAVDCGPLAAPMNGSSVGNLTVFPNIIKFSCDEGFDLLGSSVRQCTSTGKWAGSKTSCKAVDCGPLPVPLNGTRVGSLTFYPNTMTFACDEGFLIRGSVTRRCQLNRRWSGTRTTCNAVDCGPLATPVNGSLAGDATTFPNIIRFTCDEGFDLLGSSARKCMPSRKWNGTLTSCKGKHVIHLMSSEDLGASSVHHQYVIDTSSLHHLNGNGRYPEGDKKGNLSKKCFIMLLLSDESRLRRGVRPPRFECENMHLKRSMEWDENYVQSNKILKNNIQVPLVAVDCGPLPSPRNGSMEGSRTFFPNKITFRCDKGFTLKGSSTRVCQANRAWSGETTTCQAVDCGRLNAPVNGSMIGALTVYPSVISFSCDEGFDLLGSSLRKCTSEGRWDGSSTSSVDCGPLSAPTNGSKIGSLTYYPNKVWFKCNKGFLMRGSQVRACQANQRWNGTRTSC